MNTTGLPIIGLGTIINTAAVAAGGLCGLLFGKKMKERQQESLQTACGISVIFIGTAGVLEGMLTAENGRIQSGHAMMVTLCLALGTLVGEILNIEHLFEKFGEWLKQKTGNAKDGQFINGFVTASLTVCIGAMAIIGSIEDGINGNYSVLATKSVLDFVIIMVMTCSLGKGCIFSSIPIFVIEGLMTVSASLLKPLMTDNAMHCLSMIGSVLIFCVGLNLIRDKKIRVANMLPSVLFAIGASFVPFDF